jgi:hypothetical protein
LISDHDIPGDKLVGRKEQRSVCNVPSSLPTIAIQGADMYQSDDEQLRLRAYAIWERQGCPQGKDQEIWELAIREMNGQAAPQVDQGEWPKAQDDPSRINKVE